MCANVVSSFVLLLLIIIIFFIFILVIEERVLIPGTRYIGIIPCS